MLCNLDEKLFTTVNINRRGRRPEVEGQVQFALSETLVFNYFQIRLPVNYAVQGTVGTGTLSVCKINKKSCLCLGFYTYDITTPVTRIELFFPCEATLQNPNCVRHRICIPSNSGEIALGSCYCGNKFMLKLLLCPYFCN